MGFKKVFIGMKNAMRHAELTGMHIEEVDGKFIVYTKQPSVDTTADITVIYEDVEIDSAPKKAKKNKSN
jgi:hypothetical protein